MYKRQGKGVTANPGQAVGLVKAVVCGSPFLFGTELALVVVIIQGRVRGREPVTGIGGGLVAGRQGSGCRDIFINGNPVAVIIERVVIGGDHRIARGAGIYPGQPVGIIIGVGGHRTVEVGERNQPYDLPFSSGCRS